MSELTSSKKMLLTLGVSLLSFTGFLDATIVSTALPNMQRSLHMPVAELQWIMTAFFIGASAFMASMGRLADIYGRRKVFYIGIFIFALASIGAGLATAPWFLIFCRVVQGITTAITIPVGLVIVQTAHSKQEASKATGFFASITCSGLALGPVFGGILVTYFGWPAVFFVNIAFIVLGFLLCAGKIEESRSPTSMTVDYLGIIFLTLSITAFVFGITGANTHGWGSETTILSFIAALVSLVILIIVEHKAQYPIMAGYLFRNRVFVPAAFVLFAGGGAMSVVLFIDPLYLHVILNKSNVMTSIIMFIIPFVVVLSAYVLGHLSKIISAKLWLIIATLGYLLMSILHMYFGVALDYKILVPAFVLMGLAWGIINVVPAVLMQENIQGDHIGVAIGALFSFFNIGAAAVLAFAVLMFHVRVFSSLLAQFAKQHIVLGAGAIHGLKQFVGQPDKMQHLANTLGISPVMADNILRRAFVSGMGHMFLSIGVLAVLACLVVAGVMRRSN